MNRALDKPKEQEQDLHMTGNLEVEFLWRLEAAYRRNARAHQPTQVS